MTSPSAASGSTAAEVDSAALPSPPIAPDVAARFARLALDCVHREYPNKVAHVLRSDADARPPRELTAAFYGCYDWHSAVHAHWMLARLARLLPGEPLAVEARAALARSLTADNLAEEVRYLEGEGRDTFERPYGLAWLLQLATELREWEGEVSAVAAPFAPEVRRWVRALAPLERSAADRFLEWVPKLSHPIRTGEHSQTAFAFGLALDWARGPADDPDLSFLLVTRSRELYLGDRDCPLSYEPSGQDFLSPCLAEADLVRRLLPQQELAAWLGGFLPEIPLGSSESWLVPAVVTDPTDGKLAHLDGLNLSRAWMLDGIAAALPGGDPRRVSLASAALAHRLSGLGSVTGEHYEGGHWLGSFATYLVTGRGLP